MGQPILLSHRRAPGDIVCMTACIRDLALTYPDRYDIHVWTTCLSLWDYNPHITKAVNKPIPGMKRYDLTYGHHINQANRVSLHFLTSFHRSFQEQTGVEVPVLLPKGDLHLSDWHKANRPIEERYWYVIAGGKNDFTTKIWSSTRHQQVINILRQYGLRIVQGGANHSGHWHPRMDGVLDLLNRTNLRDMMWLIYHADGVICPITSAMHMAAALDRPCVVIAGGREHWWWEAYVNVNLDNFGPHATGKVAVPHRYLHTQGLLDCCHDRGCWKNKVVSTQRDKNRSYCKYPVGDTYGQTIPHCLEMIKVEHVIEAVMSYYADGTLPPIGEPPKLQAPNGKPIVPGTLSEKPKEDTQAPPELARTAVDLFAPPSELRAAAQPAEVVTHAAQLPEPPNVVTHAATPVPAPPQLTQQLSHTPPKPAREPATQDPFDDPIIGGQFTICVLMYGNYHELHTRCLNAILSTVPQSRRELRIACNEVCEPTIKYLSRLQSEGQVQKVHINPTNLKKYPAMRRLFHDDPDPITNRWVVWFDDDTIADRDPEWAVKLAQTIVGYYDNNCRFFGAAHIWTLHPAQQAWIKERPWYRQRPFQLKNGTEAPNGNKIVFPAGGFWALSTALIKQADIPDPEIGHNGGDYMLAEQVWQAGYKMKNWNGSKQFVHTSSVKRRGLTETHTGMPGWTPGGPK